LSSDYPVIVEPDRRFGPNRRNHNFWQALFSRNRRRKNTGRRDQDSIGYVDFYDGRTWALAFSLFTLSILDAIFTAIEISAGKAREANPLMNLTLGRGGLIAFFGIKAALTAFPLAILVMHKEWKLARITARICLSSYVVIILYHLYLLFGCPA
jgi:hypothetical protein